ncbi:SRPBCC domain-containing protein [Isoptericola sp. NPDC057559]|uniref:SRPBCC domain-containing protein n=1 Tax=Isoptericola sp. NPDC057559 TaxID=3346168 RepID=UPI0036C5D8DC
MSTDDVLRRSVTVTPGPEDAFRLFTAGLGEWWPLATHSVGREGSRGVVLEPGVGGRLVETLPDGGAAVWGTVTAWDPPRRVAFTWHPGTPEAEATQVEVTFRPDGSGTVVELAHSGWARRADGDRARVSYGSGWRLVLGAFAERAGTLPSEGEEKQGQAGPERGAPRAQP